MNTLIIIRFTNGPANAIIIFFISNIFEFNILEIINNYKNPVLVILEKENMEKYYATLKKVFGGSNNIPTQFIDLETIKKFVNLDKYTSYNKNAKEAKDMINKTDKSRSSYYNYYTNKKWGSADSYNLCLDSSKLGIDGTAKAIIEAIHIYDSLKK